MKRFLITVLAALTISGAAAQEAFPDIPAGHWAGEAVSRIADLGIVIGFPDGTFRGNESFTRYQAALVVSRLLDVISADIEAAQAMTDADIAALRNALQELASDVAAQGARLGAVEDAVAGLSDDVMANQARIEALEAAIDLATDPAVLQDLQNQLAALRTQADTALARAEAAEALANEALDAIDLLEAQVRQNAQAIRALNDLVALLSRDVAALQVGEEIDPAFLDRIARNEADIANIREFVILLRRDQVQLRERVAALEGRVDAQDARIDDLDARLTQVEEDLLTLSGSLTLTYYVGRGTGEQFDVDRAYGIAQLRPKGASTFTTGAPSGQTAADRVDMPRQAGGIEADLSVSFGFGQDRVGVGPFGAEFESTIELSLRRAEGLFDGEETFTGYVFALDRINVFTNIGGAPLTFQFGENIRLPGNSFTGYVFDTRVVNRNNRSEGFIASVGAPDFLAFLNPTLTIAYGSPFDIDDAYFRAARLTVNPLDGVTIGGSFAQYSEEPGPIHAADPLRETTVFGVDASISISVIDINAEFAQSSTTGTNVVDVSQTLIYVDARVDGSELIAAIEPMVRVTYRSIPNDWQGLMDSRNYGPFNLDQQGFGVSAALSLFIVDIEGYFDSYATGGPDFDTQNTAFGVGVGADLFAGFSISGFFRNASVDGDTADRATNRGDPLNFDRFDFSTGRNYSLSPRAGVSGNVYSTGFGVKLAHDGGADNALIDGLNLKFQYQQLGADLDISVIDVEASYALNVSILSLTPIVQFVSFNEAEGPDNTTTVRVGTVVSTDPLDIFLRPSLNANVNYRTTSHTQDPGFTSQELQFSVELALNEFLFENSTLRARYGSYSGTNVATVARVDANLGGATMSTNGYEVIWDYFGLEMAYGVYLNVDTDGSEAVSQAFRIKYTVEF
jgi:predicted  nucleic acid-binding Zn-ribbon protein